MSLLFRAHTQLPKMTTDHRRDINIFTVCWKRTSDKIKHRTSTNNGSHVKKIVFRAGFCSDLKSESHDAHNKTLGNPQHVFRCRESTGLPSANDAIHLLSNCSVRAPSHQIFVRKTVTLACFRRGLSRCRPASQPLTQRMSSRTIWLTDACLLVKFESETHVLPHVGKYEHILKTSRHTNMPNICRAQLLKRCANSAWT